MSQKASGYERVEGDRYFTPAWCTEALLSVVKFDGPVLDPGAGAGHIMDVLTAAGYQADGIDLEPGRDDIIKMDFFDLDEATNICANPAYGKQGRLAVRIIKHALALTAPTRGKVAMLLRVDFDSASTRADIFDNHPAFAAKYALTKRIRWTNLPQSKAGPTENHAWFVWDWKHHGHRTYGYLP